MLTISILKIEKGVGFIKTSNFTYGVKAGLHLGYNSDKFFFGGGVSNRIMDYIGQDKPTNALSNNLSFNIFIGHRFRAPKQVRKTVDFIDEKIPFDKRQKLMVVKEMYESSRRALHKGIVANLFLFVAKLISGLLGNSYALIADAIEFSYGCNIFLLGASRP